ncbi:hypothetical protein SAMN04488051_1253, partial [Alkalimonas amylolytica]
NPLPTLLGQLAKGIKGLMLLQTTAVLAVNFTPGRIKITPQYRLLINRQLAQLAIAVVVILQHGVIGQ